MAVLVVARFRALPMKVCNSELLRGVLPHDGLSEGVHGGYAGVYREA